MPRGLSPEEKKHVWIDPTRAKVGVTRPGATITAQAEPTPKVVTEPTPVLIETTTEPIGPLAGRIDYVAPPTTKEEAIEREIESVYAEAPIVEKQETTIQRGAKPGAAVTVQVYEPTPEQEQKIISLAEQLPPEKAEKYITVEPVKEEPKGIAETLVSIKTEDIQQFIATGIADLAGLKGEQRERFLQSHQQLSTVVQPKLVTGQPLPIFGEPVQAVAGTIAAFEAPVYSVGRLVGLETPRPPPTLTGGLIGKGAALVTGAPPSEQGELSRVTEYGPSYMAGTVMGDILLGYLTGKAVSKVTPTRVKEFVSSRTPEKLKKLFQKTELEVQRRYDPHAQYALKQARYRPHYALKSDLGKFLRGTKVRTGVVAPTPFSTTLAKTVEIPTRTGQVLLQKTTQQAAKQLPTLTLTKTVAPVVRTVAPKVVAVTVSPTTLGKLVSPFVWAGAKFPSVMKTDIWEKVQVKVKPYPVVAPLSIKPYPKAVTEPTVVSTPVVDGSAMIDEIMSPQISPVVSSEVVSKVAPTLTVAPIVAQTSEVSPTQAIEQIQETAQVETQIQKQIQRQQLRQMQIQRQRLIKQQLQVPEWLMPQRRRKRKKKKRSKPLDFYGRYKRAYPVATAKEFLEMMI